MAKCSSESYGYTYLTSYGWAGSGTGLRRGAIDKPLTIPPKKNLSGLGRERDDAFPFWDHLFTAASKAITIKVLSDDESVNDTKDTPSQTHPDVVPLRRTATGIISNRRPVSGTPASASGCTTPNLITDEATPARPSLLATAKREAAKRGLYSRFFRGPVLGPDDDSHARLAPSSSLSETSPTPMSAPGLVDHKDDVIGETKKSKKPKTEDRSETRDERKERKRLKKERKAVRLAQRAEKSLQKEKAKKKKDRLDDVDRKARKHRDKETEFRRIMNRSPDTTDVNLAAKKKIRRRKDTLT